VREAAIELVVAQGRAKMAKVVEERVVAACSGGNGYSGPWRMRQRRRERERASARGREKARAQRPLQEGVGMRQRRLDARRPW
jgi:hypothetical protein